MVYHIRKYLSPVVSPLFHGSGRVSSRIEYQAFLFDFERARTLVEGGKKEKKNKGLWLTIDRSAASGNMEQGPGTECYRHDQNPLGAVRNMGCRYRTIPADGNGEATKHTSTGSKQPGKQEPRDRAANRAGYSGRSERLLLLSAAMEHCIRHHVD
ncbi:hypothetical protein ACSS6W_010559 [Trichoderma asperelloides]